MALDYNADDSVIKSLTNLRQKAGSCQFEDAIQTGNIQFGNTAAAVFGSQWITQHFRIVLGEKNALHPKIKSESIEFLSPPATTPVSVMFTPISSEHLKGATECRRAWRSLM